MSNNPTRESVTRYVVTYVKKDGMRTLIGPAQGRNTYATAAEAEEHMRSILSVNSASTIRDAWGENPRFEVRPCPCYPGHFDPQNVWFDDPPTLAAGGPMDRERFGVWLNPPGLTLEQKYDRARMLAEIAEVTEDVYIYHLEMLPPMNWNRRGFCISEAATEDLRLGFFQVNRRFFAAYVSDYDRSHTHAATFEKVVRL